MSHQDCPHTGAADSLPGLHRKSHGTLFCDSEKSDNTTLLLLKFELVRKCHIRTEPGVSETPEFIITGSSSSQSFEVTCHNFTLSCIINHNIYWYSVFALNSDIFCGII